MFIESITFLSGQLGSGTTTRIINAYQPAISGKTSYRPTKIFVTNNSGGTVNLGFFTSAEYNKWISGLLSSQLFPLANNTSLDLENVKDSISYCVASGTTGHSSNLVVNFIRE